MMKATNGCLVKLIYFSRVVLLINVEACCKSGESQPGLSTVT